MPLWFWRDFNDVRKAIYQWDLGKVRGEARRDGEAQRIQLQDLHFHRSGLINLGLAPSTKADEPAHESKRGRRPHYDWPAASLAIFGLIYRGDLKPETQADIERALIGHLTKGDNSPSESTVRPFAKQIWDEYSRA